MAVLSSGLYSTSAWIRVHKYKIIYLSILFTERVFLSPGFKSHECFLIIRWLYLFYLSCISFWVGGLDLHVAFNRWQKIQFTHVYLRTRTLKKRNCDSFLKNWIGFSPRTPQLLHDFLILLNCVWYNSLSNVRPFSILWRIKWFKLFIFKEMI